MFSVLNRCTKFAIVVTLPVYLSSCGGGGGGDEEAAETLALSQDTAFAFVERSISGEASNGMVLYQEKLASPNATPQDLNSPYAFNPGARLVHRSSIDVDAVQWNVLDSYFGSSQFDVKDLSVSEDGSRMVFAAHGPLGHESDYSWNIYEYDFAARKVRRIIADDEVANSGQDTNPTYTEDGRIVFSSDRAIGNPGDEMMKNVSNSEEDRTCYKIGPAEKPSLLHRMSDQGEDIVQLTFGNNHDTKTTTLTDGRVAFVRWSRSYELLSQCGLPQHEKAINLGLSTSEPFAALDYPTGLAKPEQWSNDRLCAYAIPTPIGMALPSNHYTLLTIEPDTLQLEQLYETVTIHASDEEFVYLDKLVQGSDGYLAGVIKHFYNEQSGGNLVSLRAPNQANDSTIFGKMAPQALAAQEVSLYPEQLSPDGWYSAVFPYRDGSSRVLVSWSQCATQQNGVNSFCRQGNTGDVNSQYGIWVYDAKTDSRLPVVRSRSDVVYTDLAMARAHTGPDLPFTPVNSNFVDNLDESRIICDDPSDIPPTDPTEPTDPTDPTNPTDPNDPNNPSDPTDPSNPVDPGNPIDPTDPTDPGDPNNPTDPTDPDPTSNQAPVAHAGADQSVNVGQQTNLDGSASNDPDAQPNPLSYVWRFAALPLDSSLSDADISNASSATPSFVPDVRGNFALELEVSDGAASDRDQVEIVIANTDPVADAGMDANVIGGLPVTLDGSASYDADNDRLSYRWSFLDTSPSSTLSDADIVGRFTATPSFTPDEAVEYPIKADFVFVIDGSFSMQEEIAEVRNGLRNFVETITDPDSDIDARFAVVTFEERPLGSTIPVVKLAFTESSTTADVADEVIAAFDGIDTSSLGSQQREAGLEAIRAVLDPSSVSPPLTGLEFRSKARKSLILATDEDSDGPYNGGDYEAPETFSADSVWQLEVDATAAMIIANDAFIDLLVEPGNKATKLQYGDPAADRVEAGTERFDAAATLAALDDPSTGNPRSLQAQVLRAGLIARSYQVTEANDPVFVNSFFTSKISETVENPLLGTYVLSLIVNDGEADSLVDTVSIRAFDGRVPPNANAGLDQNALVGNVVQLNGGDSYDSDNAPLALSFQWRLVDKPSGSALANGNIVNATSANASFLPDVGGDYTLELTVDDGEDTDADRIVIHVGTSDIPPNANAGADQQLAVCALVNLSASASVDADSAPSPLSYRWHLVSQPTGSTLLANNISNRTSANASFTPDRLGSYVLEVEVSDGEFAGFDHVLVRVGDLEDAGLACTP